MKRLYRYQCIECNETFDKFVEVKDRNWPQQCPNGCKALVPSCRSHTTHVARRVITPIRHKWAAQP